MINSKFTSKIQLTISHNIQSRPQRKVNDQTVKDQLYLESLEAVLNEWNSDNDEEDFCDL